MGDKKENSQRHTSFRAVIPFYILWDLDLNANHLRLYGQIEQMENNPNPDVQPKFSFEWLANQLGMSRRMAINYSNKLKNKGYIQRTKISQNNWLWNTVKNPVNVVGSEAQVHHGSEAQVHHGSEAQVHLKIQENKIQETNTGEQACSRISNGIDLVELIRIYHEEFPDNPGHRTDGVISTELKKNLQTLIKNWPQLTGDPNNKFTYDGFRGYLQGLKELAPGLCFGEWTTQNGKLKKCNLINLTRWNTAVKFTEGAYS